MSQLEQLWKDYRSTGSRQAKDKILAEYASLARYTAQRLAINLPPEVELGDLIGAGVFGLIKAVESFDPDREVRFETFATWKIRGAILDHLREVDWVPRSVRQKTRELQGAYARLSNILGRTPYDDEVAEHLGLDLPEFESLLSEIAPTTIVSMDEPLGHDDDGHPVLISDAVEDPEAQQPFEERSREEVKEILKEAIVRLPEKEKLVLALYHYEELTFKEIGKVLKLTESRVCQIHSKAIVKLRTLVARKIMA